MTDWNSNAAGARAPQAEVERLSVEETLAHMVRQTHHSAPCMDEMPVCPECGNRVTSWHARNWTKTFGVRCVNPKCRWRVEAGADSSSADAWHEARRVPDSDGKRDDKQHWMNTDPQWRP